MSILKPSAPTRGETYDANRKAMLEALAVVDEAVKAALDGGGVPAYPLRPDLLARHFKSGGAGGVQQTMEKLAIFFVHGASSNGDAPAGKRIGWWPDLHVGIRLRLEGR